MSNTLNRKKGSKPKGHLTSKEKDMWNMSESDKRYYDRKAAHDEKRNSALVKARERGEAAAEWLKTNVLTKETQPEFNALMKKVDKANQ